jgi:hypothetical protein
MAAAWPLALICLSLTSTLQPDDAPKLLPNDATVLQNAAIESPSSVFARVAYINLASATERRRHVEDMLQRAGLSEARKKPLGWNGTVPTDAQLDEVLSSPVGVHLSGWSAQTQRGTIGCRASHTSLLRHLLHTGAPGETYLVVEDDVVLPEAFGAVAQALLGSVPAGWDVVRLSCRLFVDGPGPRPLSSDPPCPSCITNVTSAANEFPTFRVSDSAEAHTCDTQARPHCGYVSGGAHATIYRFDSIARLLAGMGEQPNYDVALSMPRDPSIASYCVQVKGVYVNGLSIRSTRTGSGPWSGHGK